jgi:hypothetical protein
MNDIHRGDMVICIASGVIGKAIKQYYPIACEQQTIVETLDGRRYHAPTRMWRTYVRKPEGSERP